MKRSKAITVALLLASLSLPLAGCDDDNLYGDGMAFESFEDCAVNIGADNCQKEPEKKEVATQQASSSGSGGGTSIIPLFLPMPGFHGGYLPSAPRMASGYRPSKPIFAATPSARTGSWSSTRAFSAPSVSTRGGFGSSARGFSAGS